MKAVTTTVVLGLALAASQPVFAQAPPPVHKADALFQAGRNLLDAGEYAEACPKFAEANTIAPGLGVTLYLADCYERLGKTSSALFWFRRAVELAKAKKDKRASIADGRAQSLVARVPSLVVNVSPGAVAQHVEVSEDGKPLPTSAWGVSAAIDPGDHVIDVSAPGKAPRHLTFHLAANAETHTETVAPLEEPPPVAPPIVAVEPPPAVAPPPAPPEPPPSNRGFIVGSIVTAGVGVAGIGVGTAMGLVAGSKLSDSNAGPCNGTNHCTPAGLSLRSDAQTAGNISTIAFVAGGVLVATGVVIFLVRPKARAATTSLQVSPAFGPNGGAVQLGGVF